MAVVHAGAGPPRASSDFDGMALAALDAVALDVDPHVRNDRTLVGFVAHVDQASHSRTLPTEPAPMLRGTAASAYSCLGSTAKAAAAKAATAETMARVRNSEQLTMMSHTHRA